MVPFSVAAAAGQGVVEKEVAELLCFELDHVLGPEFAVGKIQHDRNLGDPSKTLWRETHFGISFVLESIKVRIESGSVGVRIEGNIWTVNVHIRVPEYGVEAHFDGGTLTKQIHTKDHLDINVSLKLTKSDGAVELDFNMTHIKLDGLDPLERLNPLEHSTPISDAINKKVNQIVKEKVTKALESKVRELERWTKPISQLLCCSACW